MLKAGSILLAALLAAGTALGATTAGFEAGETSYYFGTDGAATLAVSAEQAHSGAASAKMQLSNATPGSDFAKVNVPHLGQLARTTASCWTYVPTQTLTSVKPYLYFIVDSNKNSIYDYPNDSLVIAFVASNSVVDAWDFNSLDASTKVHVVGNRTGLGANEFSASHGDVMGTLGDLCAKTFSGSETYGDLNVILCRVGAGEWPGAGGFTAYVDDVAVTTATPDAWKVATVQGVGQYTISPDGSALTYAPQPRNANGWYWYNNNGSPAGTLAVGGFGPNGWRDGSRTFAMTDVAAGQALNTVKLVLTYKTAAGYPTINFFMTDGNGKYGIFAPTSAGLASVLQTQVNGEWTTGTIDLTRGDIPDAASVAVYEHNGFVNVYGDPFTSMTWGDIKEYTLAGMYDYQRSPALGWGAWGSMFLPVNAAGEAAADNGYGIALIWGDTVGNTTYATNPREIKDVSVSFGGDVYLASFEADRSYYVNGTTGNDATADGTPLLPYKTIQAAINAAPAGATVTVAAGTYNERLRIGKALSVQGEDGVIVDGTGLGLIAGAEIESGNVTLNNLVITNFGGNGIIVGYEPGGPGNLQNVHITNCTVSHIQPGYSWGFGIYVGYESEGFWGATPRLTNHLDYSGLVLSGNEVFDTAGSGIALQSLRSSGGLLQVAGNFIHDTEWEAVWIESARDIQVSGNTMERCDYGVFVTGYSDGYYTGVADAPFDPQNVTVSGNVIQNCITNGIAVYDGWPSLLHFTENAIVGNPVGVRKWSGLGGGSLDAQNNWWGKPEGPGPVGPGLGDTVSLNVDYDPWLAKPGMDNSVYLEPAASSIYVQPSESVVIDLKVANLQQEVGGLQAMLHFSSTYFETDAANVNVAAGGGVWNEAFYWVQGAPGYPNGPGQPGDLDTMLGVDLSPTGQGTTADATTGVITLNPKAEGVTSIVFRTDVNDINSTFLSDMSGEAVWPVKVSSTNIYIDGTGPLMRNLTATQGTTDVLTSPALPGTIAVTVEAKDTLAGLAGPPAVTLVKGTDTIPVTYVSEAAGADGYTVYTYTATVTTATPKGAYLLTATATDKAGNTASLGGTINVDKQVAVTIELQDFVGSSRAVSFVATDATGTVLKSWNNLTVSGFSGGIATVTLTGAPDAAAFNLSAKTAWNLRSKVAATVADGAAVATLTGADKLPGGDLNNTNSVNILDYTLLKTRWYTNQLTADINGDGAVNLGDYNIMKLNWLTRGDEQ